MNNLDLYAKIEPILGINEASCELYTLFLNEIENLKFNGKKALDFGCGNGKFAKILSDEFDIMGLDKSEKMVKIAKSCGINATNFPLSKIDIKFDLITAVGDVLNYMQSKELDEFLTDIASKLKDGGYFIFDINTKFGFSDIANGVLHEKDGDNHLIIDAKFDGKQLVTQMIYFEKKDKNYKKSSADITQYFHEKTKFEKAKNLTLFKCKNINLYSDTKPDKSIFILKK